MKLRHPGSFQCRRGSRVYLVILLVLLTPTPGVYAQEAEVPAPPPSSPGPLLREVGRPYLTNYYAADYDAHVWNAAAVQDERGVLYVANNDGLLEFDGVSWRLIVLPGRSHVRSLGRGADGRIWVGGLDDFGYLAPDSLGEATFVSLQHHVPPEHRGFSFVLRTFPTEEGIYFATRARLFRYRPDPNNPALGTLDSWGFDLPIDRAYQVRSQLYLWQLGKGLSRFVDGRVELILEGERFAQMGINALFPYDAASLLIGTATAGFFLYSEASVTPFKTEADALLSTHHLVSGAALQGGRFALGTQTGGVMIVDRQGRLLHHVDAALGLQNNLVLGVYPDDSGSLWLLLNRGISRIDVDAPFTVFDAHAGLEDVALVVHRHAGRLYVGTSTGLLQLDAQTGRFQPLIGFRNTVSALLSAGGDLLVGTSRGVYRLDEDRIVPVGVFEDSRAATYSLAHLAEDSLAVSVGLQNGLAVLRRLDDTWVDAERVPGVNRFIRTVVVQRDGTIWLGTENAGAYRVRFPEGQPIDPEQAVVDYYGVDEGLPEAGATAYLVDDKAYFTAFGAKVYSFDASRERFVRDHTFDEVATGYPLDWFGFQEDERGRVWVALGNRGMAVASRRPDGSYRADPSPMRRLGRVLIITMYYESDGVLWMAGADGLIRYDTAQPPPASPGRTALIRRVLSRGDSLLYAGLGDAPPVTLAYADNTIRFEYALPSFIGQAEYRVLLDGFDATWSEWSGEATSVYTNLPEGGYTFRVVARDIDGRESEAGAFSFDVSPPWWRTGWAYALYVCLFAGLLYGIRRYEVNRLGLKHGLELERVEAEKLRELDQAKSRFFANISHEFRTPLTLILGPLTDALEREQDLPFAHLTLVQRNGRRLLRLVNQLLDLSKLDAGSMNLRPAYADLVPFLKSIVYTFESLAQQKQITLRFSPTQAHIALYFERDKLEQVFYNLLSNALKFTPEGGTVEVACRVTDDEHAAVEVRDTGIGIPADRLPHVFDRFYQVDSSHTREHEGTGIGLALTKALVELHHGELSVTSLEGEGTTFVVRLPLGRPPEAEHLAIPVTEEASPIQALDADAGLRAAGAPAQEGATAAEDREIVLVVEDNADVRAYLREHLEGDYRVQEASDGESGLALALETLPDLIITDVMMPKLDGYALSRALRTDERTSHIPIIMLTAKAEEEDKLEGLETGVDDYLLKPFSPKELRARVRNLIALRRRLRERFSTATVIQPSQVEATSLDQAFLARTTASIEAHLDEEGFTIERLADEVGLSVSQLNRKLNALIDQPAGKLIRSMRLQRGADLLERQAGTIAEIAYRVGFSNQSHFSTAFKNQFGVSPSAYQKAREEKER